MYSQRLEPSTKEAQSDVVARLATERDLLFASENMVTKIVRRHIR